MFTRSPVRIILVMWKNDTMHTSPNDPAEMPTQATDQDGQADMHDVGTKLADVAIVRAISHSVEGCHLTAIGQIVSRHREGETTNQIATRLASILGDTDTFATTTFVDWVLGRAEQYRTYPALLNADTSVLVLTQAPDPIEWIPADPADTQRMVRAAQEVARVRRQALGEDDAELPDLVIYQDESPDLFGTPSWLTASELLNSIHTRDQLSQRQMTTLATWSADPKITADRYFLTTRNLVAHAHTALHLRMNSNLDAGELADLVLILGPGDHDDIPGLHYVREHGPAAKIHVNTTPAPTSTDGPAFPDCDSSTSCPATEHAPSCVFSQVADWEGAIDSNSQRMPTTPGKPWPPVISIQPAQGDNHKRPKPYFINPDGTVRRQDYWKGNPSQLAGFQDDLDIMEVDVLTADWQADDPQAVIGMYPVFINADGSMDTLKARVETVTLHPELGPEQSR